MRTLLPIAVLIPGFLAAEVHTIKPAAYYNSFASRHPVAAKVRAGDTIVVRTLDAAGFDEKGEKRGERSNPLAGPFYVEGAAPGDALVVRIVRLTMNRNFGWSSTRLGLWALTPESIEGLFPKRFKQDAALPGRDDLVRWDIDLARKTMRTRDLAPGRPPLEFAARPMIGCIGVAPAGDIASPSSISGPHGGNLDYNAIGENATVLLPVSHPGGLLFVGDGHALQADGEPLGTGVETSMEMELQVDVSKNNRLAGPRVETAGDLITVGSQPEFASALDRGLNMATSEMTSWLIRGYGMEPRSAHVLIGMTGKYEVVTVAGSMALRVPKAAVARFSGRSVR